MNVLYTAQKLHELFCDDQFLVSASDILDKVTSKNSSPAEVGTLVCIIYFITTASKPVNKNIVRKLDSLPSRASRSGDGDGVPGHCCRLCGGDNNLRYFGDTYVWQGVEERYDHLLNDCFGVKVTQSDCMICEWCVRALRTTGRFRALVRTAFDEQNNDRNEAKKAWEKLRNNHRDALRRQSKPKSGPGAANIRPWRFQDNMAFLIPHMANRYTHPSEEMQNDETSQDILKLRSSRQNENSRLDQPSVSSSLATIKSSTSLKKAVEFATMTEKESVPAKPGDLGKKREAKKRLTGDAKGKKTNIPCDICKQRYPMLIMNARDSYKKFVCSRCKKNSDLKGLVTCIKCNVMLPSNQMAEHLEIHLKAELRAKFREHERKRARQLPKKVLPIELPKPRSQKYQCSQCSKKYSLARQLAMHVRSAHGDCTDNICCVYNEDMESNEKLQGHLLQHSGLYQCEECLLIFKNKKILAAHVASKHHVGTHRLPVD